MSAFEEWWAEQNQTIGKVQAENAWNTVTAAYNIGFAEMEKIQLDTNVKLQEIYDNSIEELTDEYVGVVRRASAITGLVGILIGLGLGFVIQTVFA